MVTHMKKIGEKQKTNNKAAKLTTNFIIFQQKDQIVKSDQMLDAKVK